MAGREECRSISFVPNKTRSFFAIERAGTRAELSRDLNCAGITGVSAGTMARRNRCHVPRFMYVGHRGRSKDSKAISAISISRQDREIPRGLILSPDINSNRGIIVSFPSLALQTVLNRDYAPGSSPLFHESREILIRRFVREELVLVKENIPCPIYF